MKQMALLHGWNYRNYTKSGCTDAWHNRESLVEELSKHFDIIKLNLPGFCGQKEPEKEWSVVNFADFFEDCLEKNNQRPSIVLGYSFGAAVALEWKLKYKKPAKIVLISPAITRVSLSLIT